MMTNMGALDRGARIVIGLALLAIPVLLLSSISKTKGQRAGVREDYAAQIERYVADVLAREP